MEEQAAAVLDTPEQPGHETFTTKADKSEGSREIEITWNVGKDVNESIEIFGAEVVHGQFKKGIIVAAQANIRRMLGATKENSTEAKFTDEQIKNFIFNEYKPGVRSASTGGGGGKAMEALIAKLMKMPVDQRKALLGIE